MLHFVCPNCTKRLRCADSGVGMALSCPRCGRAIRIDSVRDECTPITPECSVSPNPLSSSETTHSWLFIVLGLTAAVIGTALLISAHAFLPPPSSLPRLDVPNLLSRNNATCPRCGHRFQLKYERDVSARRATCPHCGAHYEAREFEEPAEMHRHR
jgi:uncharacterized protein YbaR (Trm112 family)